MTCKELSDGIAMVKVLLSDKYTIMDKPDLRKATEKAYVDLLSAQSERAVAAYIVRQ